MDSQPFEQKLSEMQMFQFGGMSGTNEERRENDRSSLNIGALLPQKNVNLLLCGWLRIVSFVFSTGYIYNFDF